MNYKQQLRKLKPYKTWIILGVLLIVLIAIYKSDTIMIDIPESMAEKIASKTNIDLYPLWFKITNAVFRFEDEVNIFRLKKNLLGGDLPIY